ncbi:tRNA-uridine aminocarboxypropyltransferase [Sulfurimonas sp.]|uniref:tRNA-uridine aminocarboxypropyltransferase n=1 Tax=Sulfurimonas sp. TaxID=2022749 RepID=UPI00262DE9E6|nr:tRNA-uridine aminocarboxypropyltransferase [Sulfurimonas sp.]
MKTYYGDREKCYECYRPKSSCMCGYFEHIETDTKFVILMHPKEFKKVKNNTGHFTHKSLPNSELFIGIDFSQNKKINEIIATHESYILYPSSDALNLSETNPKRSKKPLAIFLIDSTWACSKKMFTQSKNLQMLQYMSFTTTKQSDYEIKVQPDENYLSTMESTLVVLELLAAHTIESIKKENLENFLNPFYEMIRYQKRLIANPTNNAVRFKRHTKHGKSKLR